MTSSALRVAARWQRAREVVPLDVLKFTRIEEPPEVAEFFFVERQGVFYTLYFKQMGNLSLGIAATSKSKGKGVSDYDRIVNKHLKSVTMMGGSVTGEEAEVTSTRMDAEAKRHLAAFDSPMFGVDWEEEGELGTPQEDFLPYIQKQLSDWKGSPVALSATQHEYWPEFHRMVQEAVQRKYGSTVVCFRGIHGRQAKDLLDNPGAALKLNTYSSWTDSLDAAKEYRKKGDWVVVRSTFKARDIALAPVKLPDFIEPDVLRPLATDVYHTGDELVVGPKRALRDYRVVLKTRRKRAAARPKMEVFKSGDEVAVNIGVQGEGEVGFLILKKIAFDVLVELHHNRPDLRGCETNVQALHEKVFGEKQVPVYYVVDVELQPEYRGKGLGLKMYEAALKKARPAILITGGCKGMGTSEDAMRVWKKLMGKYPSMGKGKADSVLAVK